MKISIDNRRLKIAVLIRHFNSSGGGAERYCVELTKKLAEIHEVHVFTQYNHESLPDIKFHQIPQWFKRPRYLNQLLFSYLTKRATQNYFDIVHSHDTVTHANIYTLHVPCFKTKWTQSKGIKKILLWLNTLLSPRKLTYLWLERQQMQSRPNKHFISVSEYLSRNILENYPWVKDDITIAHPGINQQLNNTKKIQTLRQKFREDYQIPQSSFVLLFVAHGFKRKGLPAVINALENLGRSDIHLIVAGSGDPKKIAITSSTVKQNTHFVGIVNNMDNLYPAADVLIHPTLGDTYGMVVLEAMSHKLPTIVSSSQYCGFSEHITNQEAMILTNPQDSSEILDKIQVLYESPELRNALSHSSEKIANLTSWEATFKSTLIAYSHIKKQR